MTHLDASEEMAPRRVAVIGAGLCGLSAARALHDQGHQVTVLEKSRGLGGRSATRRSGQAFHFDHGAQYFTLRDRRLKRWLESWLQAGIVSLWQPQGLDEQDPRYVACPGMSSLARHLGRGLDIQRNVRVAPPSRTENGWTLERDDGEALGHFEVVLITAPAEQSAPLLKAAPKLASLAASAATEPCWALMLGFGHRLNGVPDALIRDDERLSFIARNSSEPDRPAAETFVVHASPEWSRCHLEDTAETVAARLTTAFFEACSLKPEEPLYQAAHRWRYARVARALDQECIWDPVARIGAGGDWCLGPRIEAALLSGQALASCVLRLSLPL